MALRKKAGLNRELGLLDVIAISTGAMISAGFFLLPGIAARQAGPSVFLAYFFASLLMLPAMFSMAELASATPKAGGAYFFIDRSLGPLFGAIGGIGNYLALTLKTAFALVGIGAYAALFFDVPVKLTAIVFALVFLVMNVVGVKKTSRLQQFFVLLLLVVMIYFVAEGLREIFFSSGRAEYLSHLKPFLPNGMEGLMATTGLVFVSYLGLTQIATMSEEIRKPERNIPLGMILSLLITAVIYVFGVFIMVGVIPGDQLWYDLAPVSSASAKVFSLVSPKVGTLLIVFAAITAFASTGNAGMMTASRIPLAMSRDKMLPETLSRINRFNTPAFSILLTAAVMLVVILFLRESDIARLASSFQLMLFMLLNVAVIVMRNSRIEAYDPGYKSPLYPWMQIFGIVSTFFMLIAMGWGSILFIMVVAAIAVAWYWYYAREKTSRGGAIYHWFALLGKKEHKELENELLHILKEKGLRDGDPFDEMIVSASITDLVNARTSFRSLVSDIVEKFSLEDGNIDAEGLKKQFKVKGTGSARVIPEVLIIAGKDENAEKPMLHVVLSEKGIRQPQRAGVGEPESLVKVIFFMVNKASRPKQRLRFLSRLMDIIERERFTDAITSISNPREIKEYLLHNDRYITLHLEKGSRQEEFTGRALKEIRLSPDVLVAMIQRKEITITPRGDTVLQEGDIITIIGEPKGIRALFNRYIHDPAGE